jgi:hypothetical protein
VAKKQAPPNPAGRDGKPIRVPLEFDEALRAALETPRGPKDPPSKKSSKKS